MPLSIADRLHRLPFGAQAAVVEKLHVNKSIVSQVARGGYQPKTEDGRAVRRQVQEALAAQFVPPMPVWEAFAEWDGETPTRRRRPKKAGSRPRAKAR